jgi:small neutral amino acid transporter SnatA (MarC family)
MTTFSRTTIPTVPEDHAPQALRLPLAHPLAAGPWWLVATVLFSLVLYYFVGIDQGALSVFGNDMHIHEFAHDGRHVLAFPCH